MPHPSGKALTQGESAVLLMTDVHYGRKTASYNPKVFAKRLTRLSQTLGGIREGLASLSLDRLVVFMAGDMNDGTDIYATQPHEQAESNVEAQADELSELLSSWLLEQKRIWGTVSVEAVPGNHGRAGKRAAVAANWDMVFYRYLALRLGEAIPVGLNPRPKSPFIRKVELRDHQYILYHGHRIKSYFNIPWYGMSMRLHRWMSTRLAPFDMVCLGHFHTFGAWDVNRKTILVSGTMITDDDWALEEFGWESSARWWLFGVSDKHPMTWQYRLELE